MYNALTKLIAAALAGLMLISVPVREFFEERGGYVAWDGALRQVTIDYEGNQARLYILDNRAVVNNTGVDVPLALEGGVTTLDVQYLELLLELLTQEPTQAYTPGDIAYAFLLHMYEYLPNRIAFSQKERDTAEWIVQELINMGHDPSMVYLQEFDFEAVGMSWLVEEFIHMSTAGEEAFAPFSSFVLFDYEQISGKEFLTHSQNVILTVPGQSERTIVVGAHYDGVFNHGISDNASGVVLLLESAQNLLNIDHYYTIQYVFFGAEEVGLIGAFYFVENLTEEEAENLALMINVDVIFDGSELTFGAGYFDFVEGEERQTVGTQTIIDIAAQLNNDRGLELVWEPYGIFVSTDQLAFVHRGFPVAVLYAVYNFVPNPPMVTSVAWDIEIASLILAMLDETDDEYLLEQIEYRMEDIEFGFMILSWNTEEDIMENLARLEEMAEEFADEPMLLEFILSDLELFRFLTEYVISHPRLPEFIEEFVPEIMVIEPGPEILTLERLQLVLDVLTGDADIDELVNYPYPDLLEMLFADLSFLANEVWLELSLESLQAFIDEGGDIDEDMEYAISLIGLIAAIYETGGLEELAEALGIDFVLQELFFGAPWGYVLHTVNDTVTYLHENWPGLIQRALYNYSIFLEAILTLPGGTFSQ